MRRGKILNTLLKKMFYKFFYPKVHPIQGLRVAQGRGLLNELFNGSEDFENKENR